MLREPGAGGAGGGDTGGAGRDDAVAIAAGGAGGDGGDRVERGRWLAASGGPAAVAVGNFREPVAGPGGADGEDDAGVGIFDGGVEIGPSQCGARRGSDGRHL